MGDALGVDQPEVLCVCSKCGPPWRNSRPEPQGNVIERLSWGSWMALCPSCGNKRCPGAADHENECSGSNEPGQAGSNYPASDFWPDWMTTDDVRQAIVHGRTPRDMPKEHP